MTLARERSRSLERRNATTFLIAAVNQSPKRKICEYAVKRARMVDVRVRDDDGLQGPVEIRSPLKEVIEIRYDLCGVFSLVAVLQIFIAGIYEHSPSRKFKKSRASLPDIDRVNKHCACRAVCNRIRSYRRRHTVRRRWWRRRRDRRH